MKTELGQRLDDLMMKGAKFEALMAWLDAADLGMFETPDALRRFILEAVA